MKKVNKSVEEADHLMTHEFETSIERLKRIGDQEQLAYKIKRLKIAKTLDKEAEKAFIDVTSNGIRPSIEMKKNIRFIELNEAWRWRNWYIKEWEPLMIDVEEFRDDAICTRLLKMMCKSKGYLPWFENQHLEEGEGWNNPCAQ